MRKYDSKNKRNIGIIIGICLIVIVIFSYFLYKEIKVSKIKYELEESTTLFDADKNKIFLEKTGLIKKRWSNNYYLDYDSNKYQIGSHVIAYTNNKSMISLYGEFYEVNKKSEVNITKEETILSNLSVSKFYKISDRKYLIVDSDIKTTDESLKTKDYLIIELDKQGNAILYNNNINVKVFKETTIVTSSFSFDIANELLIYGEEKIDLKKVLGTTNEYKKDDKKDNTNDGDKQDGNDTPNDNTTNNNGNGNTTGGNTAGGNGNNNGNNTTGGNTITDNPSDGNNNNGQGNVIPPDEIIDQTSYTSIIRIIPHTNSIDVDYVIYDKKGEYISTYVEVRSVFGTNIVHMSKSTTSLTLNNLVPGVDYELTFKYTHLVDEEVKSEVIDTHPITTILPNITLTGTKVTNKKIDYKITTESYTIGSSKLRLYLNGEKIGSDIEVNNSNLVGTINISEFNFPNNSIVELRLEDIYIGDNRINKNYSWSYRVSYYTEPEPTPSNPDETDKGE